MKKAEPPFPGCGYGPAMETLRALWDWRLGVWLGLACLAPFALLGWPTPGTDCPSLLTQMQHGPHTMCEDSAAGPWPLLVAASPVVVLAIAVAVEVAVRAVHRRFDHVPI